MATAPDAAEAAPPKKSKKMIIIGALVAMLLAGGGGAFWFIKQRNAASEEGADDAKAASHGAPVAPPAYLPLDNMVVNLADPGGDRVAQIGVTLVVTDAKASDQVKAFLPTIRSGVLMLISQKTAEELLTPEGKEKLAKGTLREAIIPFGGGEDEEEHADEAPAKKKKKAAAPVYPVTAVLFSSFIVQ